MSAVSQLINVSYTDKTNYVDNAGNDILGSLIEFHWGPVNILQVLSKTDFFQKYPESMPNGLITVDPTRYYAYGQLKRAFENGITSVEVYRCQGSWKYQEFNIGKDSVSQAVANAVQFASLSENNIVISSKYPGFFPSSLLGDYDAVALQLSTGVDAANNPRIFIKVIGLTKSDTGTVTIGTVKYISDVENPIEEFEGGINISELSDGSSAFIENVVSHSDFISVKVNHGLTEMPAISSTIVPFMPCGSTGFEFPTIAPSYTDSMDVFSDMMSSSSTLLISPVSDATLDASLLSTAKSRQDLQAVIGYPVANTFDHDSIKSFLTSMSGTRNMWGLYVAAREKLSVFGISMPSSAVGGYCGSLANIADTVRLNQIASAFTYGAFNGTLTETLSFDEVCDLHKLGVISIFSSTSGSLIWGVRSLHLKQSSYFGKANVMRVLTAIMRQIFPIALSAVHTDAAANEITRANYNTQFNNVISDMISKQNLQDDSLADCTGDINSDVNTKGGTKFNLILTLHFIGLVEAINIKVYATDSSVTTTINS